MVETVAFQDLSRNAFDVLIGRVQQAALQKVGSQVPKPAAQLALVAERRKAKNEMNHCSISARSELDQVQTLGRV